MMRDIIFLNKIVIMTELTILIEKKKSCYHSFNILFCILSLFFLQTSFLNTNRAFLNMVNVSLLQQMLQSKKCLFQELWLSLPPLLLDIC